MVSSGSVFGKNNNGSSGSIRSKFGFEFEGFRLCRVRLASRIWSMTRVIWIIETDNDGRVAREKHGSGYDQGHGIAAEDMLKG